MGLPAVPLPEPINREEQILWHINQNLLVSATSSAAIIAALQALQDDEMMKVYDSAGVLFYARAVFDADSGALISWTYYNADGTTGTPTGAVTWAYSVQETPAIVITTASGSVTAGKKSISIYNSGTGAATVNGVSFPAGLSVSWTASEGNTLDAVTYDGGGTETLVITTTV